MSLHRPLLLLTFYLAVAYCQSQTSSDSLPLYIFKKIQDPIITSEKSVTNIKSNGATTSVATSSEPTSNIQLTSITTSNLTTTNSSFKRTSSTNVSITGLPKAWMLTANITTTRVQFTGSTKENAITTSETTSWVLTASEPNTKETSAKELIKIVPTINSQTTSDLNTSVPEIMTTETSTKSLIGTLNLTRLGDKCYYFEFEDEKNWTSAQQFCQTHGLQLASIETEEESDLMFEHVRETNIRGCKGTNWCYIWLGGTYSKQDETWRWLTGETINYTEYGLKPLLSYEVPYFDQGYIIGLVEVDYFSWFTEKSPNKTSGFVCELENVCT